MKHLLRAFVLLLPLLASGRLAAQCQAAFTYTTNGNTITFTDASTSSSGTIVNWLWTFGDLTAPSTTQNPVHSYTACGMYVVTLNIVTNTFCSSSFSDTILVNGGTTPTYTANVNNTNGNTAFQAQPISPALTYTWDFGDSSTGTGVAPTHTYATSGTYNVCLVVSDTAGICSDTICDTVNVNLVPPSCNATFTTTVNNATAFFTASPANLGWNYNWNFGDNTTGTGIITSHQYQASGTYTVCLTIVDSANNCTSTICDTVTISISCAATFTNTGNANLQTFNATPLNINWTYSWDFGDNTFGNGVITTHTYTSTGTFTVCLTVTDSALNCTSTFCDTVNIPTQTTCPVTFTNVNLLGTQTFSAQPLSIFNTYTWTFGDNTTGTGAVTTHTYLAPGTYTVCVTMTTQLGCTSTFCDTVNVGPIGMAEQELANSITVYPNPFAETISVAFENGFASPVTISLLDVTGRVLTEEKAVSVHSSNGVITLRADHLQAGAYLLRVRTEHGTVSRMIIRNE